MQSCRLLELGTYVRSLCKRKPLGFICHLGSEVLPRCSEAVGSEARLARMSVRSFSESMSEAALRTGKVRLVARREDAS